MQMQLISATPNDAASIASFILMALHIDPIAEADLLHRMTEVAQMDDTLYSYRNARLAMLDGQPVALCLAYSGHNYHQVRVHTFSLFPDNGMGLSQQEDETGPGEFYIDSLAVLPEYRHQGIAHRLLHDALQQAHDLGLTPTIIVDPDNPPAYQLYESLGFTYEKDIFIFGQNYHKLRK